MVLAHLMQDVATNLSSLSSWNDLWQTIHWHSSIDWSLLAQKTFQTDVFAGTRAWFQNFIQTGQIWALIIGFVIGYILRGLTSYG
jgi:hypothetical protein